jgi:hypothetical protein
VATEAPEWLARLVEVHPRSPLVWREPPEPHPGHRSAPVDVGELPCRHWGQIAEELRGNPGRWAAVAVLRYGQANALATDIRSGRRGFRYSGDFEATARVGVGGHVVFARYVGGDVIAG